MPDVPWSTPHPAAPDAEVHVPARELPISWEEAERRLAQQTRAH